MDQRATARAHTISPFHARSLSIAAQIRASHHLHLGGFFDRQNYLPQSANSTGSLLCALSARSYRRITYVTQKGKWTLGAFNQNLISGDTNVSFLQPVIAYTINPKWTISAGDLQEGYDWKSDQWVNLPVGFQVGRLVQVGKTTLRLAYNPQYNFRDLDRNPEWTHIFGVGLVVR